MDSFRSWLCTGLNDLSADPVFPENEDRENVRGFLDGLEGGLTAEETCPLPIEVDDRKTVLKGVIDLIHVKNDAVGINRPQDRQEEGQRGGY